MVASSSSSSVVVRSLLVVLHEPLVASAVLSHSEQTLTGVRSVLISHVEPSSGIAESSGGSGAPFPCTEPGVCVIPADGWPKRANIHPASCCCCCCSVPAPLPAARLLSMLVMLADISLLGQPPREHTSEKFGDDGPPLDRALTLLVMLPEWSLQPVRRVGMGNGQYKG
uniref:Putative secreted protein n=1 Tax=Anopheles triannulatus TaxID=58253 RepID=A0A2M4B414_9DIPT